MPGHWQLRELAGACVNGASTAAVSPQPPSTTQADAGIAVVASDGSVSAEQEYAGANQAAGVAAMELLGSDASYGRSRLVQRVAQWPLHFSPPPLRSSMLENRRSAMRPCLRDTVLGVQAQGGRLLVR